MWTRSKGVINLQFDFRKTHLFVSKTVLISICSTRVQILDISYTVYLFKEYEDERYQYNLKCNMFISFVVYLETIMGSSQQYVTVDVLNLSCAVVERIWQ
jgi:hypothetical protein